MSAPVAFWDFDGTLAMRPGMWRACLIEALTAVDPAHIVTPEDVRARLRNGFPWHRPHVPHGHLGTPDAWWAALEPVLTAAYESAGVRREVALAASRRVRACYSDAAAWTVYADTRPALSSLHERGWRHVIVSNHVPELPELVRALGLGDLIDDVLTSAATGYEKPHAEMFRAALACAGNPAMAWMIGDNPVADVEGAEAAGIPAILVRAPAGGGTSGIGLSEAASRILRAAH